MGKFADVDEPEPTPPPPPPTTPAESDAEKRKNSAEKIRKGRMASILSSVNEDALGQVFLKRPKTGNTMDVE